MHTDVFINHFNFLINISIISYRNICQYPNNLVELNILFEMKKSLHTTHDIESESPIVFLKSVKLLLLLFLSQ